MQLVLFQVALGHHGEPGSVLCAPRGGPWCCKAWGVGRFGFCTLDSSAGLWKVVFQPAPPRVPFHFSLIQTSPLLLVSHLPSAGRWADDRVRLLSLPRARRMVPEVSWFPCPSCLKRQVSFPHGFMDKAPRFGEVESLGKPCSQWPAEHSGTASILTEAWSSKSFSLPHHPEIICRSQMAKLFWQSKVNAILLSFFYSTRFC